MDVLQTDLRIERILTRGSPPSQFYSKSLYWIIACLSASTLATAESSAPAPTPALPAGPVSNGPNSTTHEFRWDTGATLLADTCTTGQEAAELHPSRVAEEIHITWTTTAGTLYTVELSTDRIGWKLGPHLIGDGEIKNYHLLENFGSLAKSGLVRLVAYPDPLADADGDGLDTLSEVTVTRTSPYHADSDADGLYDAYEAARGTDPNLPQDPAPPKPPSHTRLIVHRPR